jgi:hypothetical protein
MPENKLVYHGDKRIFKICFWDIFHRAFLDVYNMSGVAPNNFMHATKIIQKTSRNGQVQKKN